MIYCISKTIFATLALGLFSAQHAFAFTIVNIGGQTFYCMNESAVQDAQAKYESSLQRPRGQRQTQGDMPNEIVLMVNPYTPQVLESNQEAYESEFHVQQPVHQPDVNEQEEDSNSAEEERASEVLLTLSNPQNATDPRMRIGFIICDF